MKIKYLVSDGTLLGFGNVQSLHPGSGEAEEDFSGEVPLDIKLFRRVSPGIIEEKSAAEKDEIIRKRTPVTSQKVQDKIATIPLPQRVAYLEKVVAEILPRISMSTGDFEVI